MGIYSRIKGLFFWGAFFLIILASLLIPPQSFSALPGDLVIGNYTLVSQTRVGRTTWDYTYHATITNNGAIGVRNVYATLTSPATGTLTFGEVPAGATVTSSDTFKIRVDRSYPFDQSNLVWSIYYETVNSPPVANAGLGQTAYVGNTVQLNGAGSTDVDGDILTYNWSFVSRPADSVAALSDPTAVEPSFVIDKFGNYKIQLIVNDGTENSAPHTVIISTLNSAPVANAGPAETVHAGTTVNLNGSGSSDADNDPLTFRWSFTSVPSESTAALSDTAAVKPTFHVDKPGTYEIQLIVNDGKVDSVPDTVTITTQNSRPIANAGPDQTVYVGDAVTLDGSGSSDADNDPLTFRWSFTSVPSESTAAISETTAIKPSFVPDLPDLYVAQLIVKDGKIDSLPDTVSITANVKTTTVVPDVAGLTQSAAQSAITTAKLIVGGITRINSPTVPAGQVISQNPVAGTSVAEGSSVSLVISTGPVMVTVPDVVGMTQAVAESAITAASLTVGTVTPDNSSTVPVGQVISQNPTPGTSVVQGSAVALVISTGPVMVTVPNVIGMTQAAAGSAITTASLTVGTVTTANSDTVPAGNVISQNPTGGNSVPQGTTINLVISLGPQGPVLPPEPSAVAPPVDPTVATNVSTATSFLYTGSNPIQTGVSPGTIEPKRVAVLRGKVMTRDGQPLPGVTITILSHPEYGQTLSRADGMFDMAVNGGGVFTVNYEKAGFLPAQRQVNAPWQDYAWLPEVVLTSLDPQVTAIDLTSSTPIQVVQGSQVSDDDGIRQAKILFPQGTTATMILADGSSQPLTSLNIRATEYTVGPNGPKSMPAILPPTSGYTYCVELTADEAIAAGAKELKFNQPLPFYVENFLGFPVGGIVPVGYYDRRKGAWIPSDNGKVIKILSIASGMAEVDTNGDNIVDGAAILTAMGITDAERAYLASLYSAGQSLWRVPITHFTPWDCNWPYGPPLDATSPNQPPPDKNEPPCLDTQTGSIIECQNQVLGEAVNIVGTPFSLHYKSDRVPGRKDAYTLDIPLSGASMPASAKRIDVKVLVAGRLFTQSFSAAPNQRYTFTWDGKDAYGRTMHGGQLITVRIGYVYGAVFYLTPAQFEQAFALFGTSVMGNRARQEITIWQEWNGAIGGWDARGQGMEGWSLNVHHTYDPFSGLLYLGDGHTVETFGRVISTVAGDGTDYGVISEGGPATQAHIGKSFGIAVGPDGSLYIAEFGHGRIQRVDTDGIITTVAGNGIGCYSSTSPCGDGGPATQAQLSGPRGVAVGADGSLYIADSGVYRIRRVGTDGIITTVAGGGYGGDGGPATQAQIVPWGVAVGLDGSLYIADIYGSRIRRVGTDGIITTVAGGGYGGDGGPATQAQLYSPLGVAVGADGSLYIAENGIHRIRRVGTDGIITTVAGNGNWGYSGDGYLATQAQLNYPSGVAVDADGSLYIADTYNNRIRRVGTDGIITWVAGYGALGYGGDGGPAAQAQLHHPYGIAVGPDGSIYIADTDNYRIRQVAPTSLIGFSATDIVIPSEDGSEVYHFTSSGRHIRTLDALTGAVRYQFTYDSAYRLIVVTDSDGNVTTIERDTDGNPTAIIAPFGQKTTLSLNPNGYLASIANPAGETYQFSYTDDGLLTSLTDPRGFIHSFTYDSLGLLTKDEDPAGGSKSLSRTEITNGYHVTVATAMGRNTNYLVENLSTGDQRRVNTFPDGTQTVALNKTDGSQNITLTDGTVTDMLFRPDPRFGMQSSLINPMTVKTPGGLAMNVAESRTVSLTDPTNPLSLLTLTDIINKNGQTYTMTYDAATRTFTYTTPAGKQGSAKIDSLGRVIENQLAGLDAVQYSYDAEGRVSNITQGTRNFVFSYDTQGNLANVTDPLSRTVGFEYDLAGRVTRQTLPDGRQIQYAYDASGNVIAITPPGRPNHAFNYTPVDLIKDYTPPDVGIGDTLTRYTYNIDRQLTRVTRPDGATIDIGYDSAGRLSTINYPQGTTSLSYDTATGNLKNITATDGSKITYAYDGSLLTDTAWLGSISGSVHRTYDNNFSITSESVNGANTMNFKYDLDGLLTQAGLLNLSRDPQNGLLTGSALGNITDTLGYNSFGEVAVYQAAYSGAGIFSVNYSRDDLGRIVQKNETIDGTTHIYNYTYDSVGRLINVSKDGIQVSQYVYDANENRLSYTSSSGTISGTYDNQDRLMQYGTTTYNYTANGELLSKTNGSQTTTYQYDVWGNLRNVTLPDGTQIEYLIDGQNRRIGKKSNGVLVQGFLYKDQLKPIAEVDGASNVVSRFIYASGNNSPDYMVKGGNTYRFITDHIGSPRIVADVATGTIVQRIDYDEFGNVITDTNPGFQPFGFAGGLYDSHTRLTRFGTRDYDASIGRWTAKDPIGFGDSTNLYEYVLSDPINFIDPYGLVTWRGVGAVVAGLAGGALFATGSTILGPALIVGGVALKIYDWWTLPVRAKKIAPAKELENIYKKREKKLEDTIKCP